MQRTSSCCAMLLTKLIGFTDVPTEKGSRRRMYFPSKKPSEFDFPLRSITITRLNGMEMSHQR